MPLELTPTVTSNKFRMAGVVATLAGILGGIGDILLFSLPGFASDPFAVRILPDWRILTGTLLAIGVIPVLAVGYWALSRYLDGVSVGFRNTIFLGGIYGVGIGNAIHGTVAILVQVIQRNNIAVGSPDFILTYGRLVVPLYVLFYTLMAVGTIALAVVIWRGQTTFPRWFILLLPLWSNLIVLPVGLLIPLLGDIFFPSIANLSHALMFGVMTVLMWGREGEHLT